MIELRPVYDKDGSVLLYDMFVNGRWIGSQRTLEQARRTAEWARDH